MSRKRIGARRRGRPRKVNAKHRATTRISRRTGVDPVDHGSAELRAKKLHLTGRVDVEMTASGTLFALGHLDRYQFDAIGWVMELLRRVGHAMGGSSAVHGLWT